MNLLRGRCTGCAYLWHVYVRRQAQGLVLPWRCRFAAGRVPRTKLSGEDTLDKKSEPAGPGVLQEIDSGGNQCSCLDVPELALVHARDNISKHPN